MSHKPMPYWIGSIARVYFRREPVSTGPDEQPYGNTPRNPSGQVIPLPSAPAGKNSPDHEKQ